jgi:hypothetical protein
VTVEALAAVLCLASGVFGRPAWDEARCLERALVVSEVAERHGVDPLLMVALDVHECELRDNVDAPVYKKIRGRKVLAGHDACPMGVRIMGVKKRLDYDVPALYELAATRMEGWQKWCGRGHPGGKYPGHLPARHHYVAHYNQGNPAYAPQVLALRRTFLGKEVLAGEALTPRTLEIIRRYRRIYNRSRS